NSLTSDEPAYIGAAYAYSQGIGVNPEHPLLLKLLNSLIFPWQFPQITVEIPTINYLDDRQVRLAAFDVGYRLLMYFPEEFKAVIFSSRFIYLLINSSLLIWLGIYSCLLPLIKPRISLIFAILWIFSPSFSSHSSLVAFDVAVAVSAFMVVMTLAIAVYSVINLQGKYLTIQMVILTLGLMFAINTKFSNLILFPIVIATIIITIFYLCKQKKYVLAKKFGGLSVLLLAPQFPLTALMYGFAFRQSSGNFLWGWLTHFNQGLGLTRLSAQGENVPFLMGQFRPITNGQYLTNIFFFKENFVIYGILGIILLASYQGLKKRQFKLKNLFNSWGFAGIFLGGIILSYPILYWFLAANSRFVLGYRYIYPVIIFIYFLMALTLFKLRNNYSPKILGVILSLYCIIGILAIPQTLSYTNIFWPQPKWLLSNESTINWGQENKQVVDFLLDNQLLPEVNNQTLIYQTFGVIININQYLEIFAKIRPYPLDIQSYYQQPVFEPLQMAIADLPHTYLVIDSTVYQTLYAERDKTAIAAQNWDYLEKHQPIYDHNDIMFVYQLH
ncbi:MAG: hypothetical protein RLZZ490_2095, partial [Cyanobacteriota bacterium]